MTFTDFDGVIICNETGEMYAPHNKSTKEQVYGKIRKFKKINEGNTFTYQWKDKNVTMREFMQHYHSKDKVIDFNS